MRAAGPDTAIPGVSTVRTDLPDLSGGAVTVQVGWDMASLGTS